MINLEQWRKFKMKRNVFVLFAVFLSIWSGLALADEKNPPTKADIVRVMPPSARMMTGALPVSADARSLVSKIKENPSLSYGFTTAVSEEKGSFMLGTLMADLELTIRADDREKTLKMMKALSQGLSRLGASIPLITAVTNMRAAIQSGVGLETARKASLPVLRPFIEDFIAKEGKMSYLRFGEWVEVTRLAVLAEDQGAVKMENVAEFIKEISMAGYFLTELNAKGLPAGIADSLKIISKFEMEAGTGSEEEFRGVLKALNTIYEIMG